MFFMKKRSLITGIATALVAGAMGYLLGNVNSSVDPDREIRVTTSKADNNMTSEREVSFVPREILNKNRTLESQLADANEQVRSLRGELDKYAPFKNSLKIASYISKANDDVPLSALRGIDSNGGVAFLDKNDGSLYFNAEDKISRNVVGSSPLASAVTGGKVPAKSWGIWDVRGGKWKDGEKLELDEDNSYRAFAFGDPNGHSIVTVLDEKTGETIGSTAYSGSIEDFGLVEAKNSAGRRVPLVWTMSLVNPLAGLEGDVQREILGSNFSNFRTAMELYSEGKGRKDGNGNLIPYEQYAQTMTFSQATGDGWSGGMIDLMSRINPEGKIRRGDEKSYLEASFIGSRNITTGTGQSVSLRAKPEKTIWLGPINRPGEVRTISIEGDRAVYDVSLGDYPSQYSAFVNESGINGCNIKSSGEAYGLLRVTDSEALPTLDVEIARVDREYNDKLREQGK